MDIALTIAYTLAASLIVALTFVPMMASGALKNTREIKHPWFDRILDGYEKVLRVALRFKTDRTDLCGSFSGGKCDAFRFQRIYLYGHEYGDRAAHGHGFSERG